MPHLVPPCGAGSNIFKKASPGTKSGSWGATEQSTQVDSNGTPNRSAGKGQEQGDKAQCEGWGTGRHLGRTSRKFKSTGWTTEGHSRQFWGERRGPLSGWLARGWHSSHLKLEGSKAAKFSFASMSLRQVPLSYCPIGFRREDCKHLLRLLPTG